ncbi:hypothetical protein GCM10011366_30700 [Ornithinimicrobium tianjinense]|uniref:D-glucuronyl C5-epimerase C-terminal domain-containing protein n=1 Tax=Ornithinimicrobium tianjinense TaxID=1195761 RepID=A0A917BYS9_9MICO|nr:hypothetical protein GCM10011366_30700 [Ornithinimicrobium tianjinense]
MMDSERVLNGHMWSMFGIWDYWNMNGQDHPEAERLFRGALYTVEKTGMSVFRRIGWTSYYSVWQHKPAPTYHQFHQQQFLQLYRMSHDSVWVSRATAYRNDWPEWRNTTGFAVITPRTTVAYRLDDGAAHIKDRSMKILETKRITVSNVTGAAYDRRGKVPGGPKVIRLSAGWLEDWWVPEAYGKAWSRQLVEHHAYGPDIRLYVAADTSLAVYRYDANGDKVDGKLVTLRAGQYYPADRSAITGGRASYHLTGGGLSDWWLPVQPSVLVHRNPGWRVG